MVLLLRCVGCPPERKKVPFSTSPLLAVLTCLLLHFCPAGVDALQCKVGALPNRQFSLSSEVQYWPLNPSNCSGVVSTVYFCYRGGSNSGQLNLTVSVWTVSADTTSYTLRGQSSLSTFTLVTDTVCHFYHFNTSAATPLLPISSGDLMGAKYSAASSVAGSSLPALYGRWYFGSVGYRRLPNNLNSVVLESDTTHISGQIAFAVDIGEVPVSTSISASSPSFYQPTTSFLESSVVPTLSLSSIVQTPSPSSTVGGVSTVEYFSSVGLNSTLPNDDSSSSRDGVMEEEELLCRDSHSCRWAFLSLIFLVIAVLIGVVVAVIVARRPWRRKPRTGKYTVNEDDAIPYRSELVTVSQRPCSHGIPNARNFTTSMHGPVDRLPGHAIYETDQYCEIKDDDLLNYKKEALYSNSNQDTTVHAHTQLQESFLMDSGSYAVLEIDIEDYECPMSDENGLCSQLKKWAIFQINPESIKCDEYIGAGNFANVFKGSWKSSQGVKEVAVKILKNSSEGTENRVSFLQEVAIMAQFQHPNVVKMFGTVVDEAIVMMVLEFMQQRDLLHCVQSLKPQDGEPPVDSLPKLLVDFGGQIASGMNYLHHKSFVHRDLAARNVFVNVHRVCKIGDFGMARDLDSESLYLSKGGTVPIKWTAPEAIIHHRFSSYSDVWSFGVLLYEIWSLGEKPFKDTQNENVLQFLMSGRRLSPPPGCPRKMYRFMILTWHPEPDIRPSFREAISFMSLPREDLLEWAETDSHPPCAATLGAPPKAGEGLYRDLQETYAVIS